MGESNRDRAAVDSVLQALDYGSSQLFERLAGLTDEEYLWEPGPGAWSVRPVGDAVVADFVPEADPPPLTTIAWRLWHIAVDCLDAYSGRVFATSGSGLPDDQFVGTADEAVEVLGRCIDNFTTGMRGLGDGIMLPLGPGWGPHAESSKLDLVLHAHREVVHHGAEIGLLRDLWAAGRR